jgi:hypothetical protein
MIKPTFLVRECAACGIPFRPPLGSRVRLCDDCRRPPDRPDRPDPPPDGRCARCGRALRTRRRTTCSRCLGGRREPATATGGRTGGTGGA